MEHFYADQPELSLRFYRRLLQMGVHNAELYNNLGLCCFYAQQYDMALTCMERALSLSEETETIGNQNVKKNSRHFHFLISIFCSRCMVQLRTYWAEPR